MIRIESLRMHLPAGFQHRATSISRLVGDLLATQAIAQSVSLDAMTIMLPPLHANIPDRDIAQLIVGQIHENLMGGN